MSMRNIALALVLLVGAGALSVPRSSFAGVSIDIDIAPPVARVEVVPPARVGFVWAPGYWDWRGSQHVWVAGSWMRERPGYHWVGAHWGRRGPHWHFEPGHWAR